MNTHLLKYGIVCLAALVLSACTSTGMVSTWTDINALHPPVDKLLIAGMTDNQENRAMFEEALAKELEQKGMTAVKSTSLIQNRDLDAKAVMAEAKKRGIAFVMVTRIVEIAEREIVVPEYNPILYAYESGGNHFSQIHKFRKTKTIKQKHVKLQTDLFDAGTEQRIWSAISETTKADTGLSARDVIDSVCTTVSEELQPSRARG